MSLNNPQTELKITNILAGFTGFFLDECMYLIGPIDIKQKYFINKIYVKTIEDAEDLGMMTFDDIINYMKSVELWSNTKDEEIKSLGKEIENLKVNLYKNRKQNNKIKEIRNIIKFKVNRLDKLFDQKFSLHYTTSTGFAAIVKNNYEIAYSLYDEQFQLLWKDDSFLQESYTLINHAQDCSYKNKLSDTEYRSLVRSNEWTFLWNTSKLNLLPVNSANWTDEQHRLVSWSKMYDNIHEHPECPDKEVIEDDDMLDGWMLIQHRDSKKENTESMISNNPKISGADEVYIVAKSKEEVDDIHALNDPVSQAMKRSREKQVREQGKVMHRNLADVMTQQQIAKNRKFIENSKRK